MLRTTHRAGLVLGCLALASAQAFALPMWKKEWSKVENKTDKDYLMTENDRVRAVGSVWVRPAGVTDSKKWKKIKDRGTGFTFQAGKKYEVYFDTTGKGIGIHLLFSADGVKGTQLHVTNLDPLVTGTEIQVACKPLSACTLKIDPSGYRNLAGGTLLTMVPAGSSTGTEAIDEEEDN